LFGAARHKTLKGQARWTGFTPSAQRPRTSSLLITRQAFQTTPKYLLNPSGRLLLRAKLADDSQLHIFFATVKAIVPVGTVEDSRHLLHLRDRNIKVFRSIHFPRVSFGSGTRTETTGTGAGAPGIAAWPIQPALELNPVNLSGAPSFGHN
jgi:hypothetical protein